ncbi:prepilin-type N-terminal cleavage/methylation domain-containing protein [Vibrio rotiferianus]|uniref:Prepilin-type N-terminal cleavage/methylation domain-containing protein n=1 Tax=Vibrio rotiferianus TaxID=190895 RepID=A0A7Y4DZW3_9VIBR|nr:prepilin-type N-terminal cleavage/methylation domain-containing protein [Vibrio rotiferianus]NOH46617.1 prepilin-type N-terminal cleavage/methylation domain-containing protein [Vibrio rotiferianus]
MLANKPISKQSRGFTLIEVLVALAILAGAFSVIFQGFNQVNINNFRVESLQQKVMLEDSIFRELQSINPSEKNSGVGKRGEVHFQWKASPISALAPLRTEEQTTKTYIQMFRVDVKYQNKGQEQTFDFEQMGWEFRK